MKTILITGASDGIGHALALRYAAGGARVFGTGRRAYPSSLLGSVHAGDYCVVDLAEPTSATTLGRFLDERSVLQLDGLIHNAALGWYGPPAQQSPVSIDEMLTVNLYAPIALTHALLPRVRAAKGVVAFVSSVHSALPTPDFAVYTASKAALDGFARNLRIEERGAVDVLTLWPGPTRTAMHVRSGVPQDKIPPARYAAPDTVAAEMMAIIQRRRSRAIGLRNRLLRWAAVQCEPLVDTVMITLARRSRRS